MQIPNCPKCNHQIAENDKFCANCGYNFNNPILKNNNSEKKSPIFQIISFVTFFISLYTPMLFLSFFILIVIGSAIISLIRKEKRWGLSLIALFLGLFLFIAPAITESQELLYKNKLSVVNWNWETERNYTYVRGRIKNNGDKIVQYFKIKALYLDNVGNVLDTDIDNSLDDLYPGMSKEFQIMHKYNSEYKRVSLMIEEVRIK